MDIKAGQVWVVKAGENDGGEAGEPVMIDNFANGYLNYFYFRRGNSSEFSDAQKLSRFLNQFEFKQYVLNLENATPSDLSNVILKKANPTCSFERSS